jgi:hypothetical protein
VKVNRERCVGERLRTPSPLRVLSSQFSLKVNTSGAGAHFPSHFRSRCSLFSKPLPEPELTLHATSRAGAHFVRHFRSRCSFSKPLPEPVLTLHATSGASDLDAVHFQSRYSPCAPVTSLLQKVQKVHFREWCLPSTPIPELLLIIIHFRRWCSLFTPLPTLSLTCTPFTELALTIHSSSGTVHSSSNITMFTVLHFQKTGLTVHYTSGTCAHLCTQFPVSVSPVLITHSAETPQHLVLEIRLWTDYSSLKSLFKEIFFVKTGFYTLHFEHNMLKGIVRPFEGMVQIRIEWSLLAKQENKIIFESALPYRIDLILQITHIDELVHYVLHTVYRRYCKLLGAVILETGLHYSLCLHHEISTVFSPPRIFDSWLNPVCSGVFVTNHRISSGQP